MPDADGYRYHADCATHRLMLYPYTGIDLQMGGKDEAYLWVTTRGWSKGHLGEPVLLTRLQAARLAALLQEYADTGTILPPKENADG